MPGARCTGGLVRGWRSGGCAHEHTGSAEASGIPCVMALRLMPRSPPPPPPTGGLVCNGESGCAHEHTGSAEAPGIPCVMVLRLMPRSPRRRIHLVTVVGGFWRPLNPVGLKLSPPTWHQQRVSGPHGFAVRSNVVRPARFQIAHEVQLALRPPWRADAVASTTSHPAFVTTRDRPSCRNGTAGAKPLIWGRREAESCPPCHSAATRRRRCPATTLGTPLAFRVRSPASAKTIAAVRQVARNRPGVVDIGNIVSYRIQYV